MKNRMKCMIGILLVMAMCIGLCTGCKGGAADNELTYYITATERPDTPGIVEKIQNILLEKTGYKVNFEYLSQEAYDLTISSGEEFDLIYAPDWLNYWSNAEKGAFMEITDEELKKYVPYVWENAGDTIDVTKLKGTRYGIAAISRYASDRCLVARGDLMEKYGIEDLNSIENIEKFLDAVKANEPDMIPFDIPGNAPWHNLAMFAYDWGWAPVGGLSFGEHVYYDLDDPEHKLFIAVEKPEMLEFTKIMKRWNDKGFFSKSVLSNKTNSLDSFRAGRTALAFTSDPMQNEQVWAELSADDRASWNIRFFSRFHNRQQMYNYTNNIVSISATSKKKEACLKVINELYSNEELYKLFTYGEEGKHYKVNEDGTMTSLPGDENRGSLNLGIVNDAYKLDTKLTFPGNEALVKRLFDIRELNPSVNMAKSDENVREISVSLSEVYSQYTTPRMYGVLQGTEEETLKKELDQLKKAGIDEYIADLQTQLDEYYAGIGK